MRTSGKRLTAMLCTAATALSVLHILPASAAVEKDNVLFSAEAESCKVTTGGEVTQKVYQDEYPGFSGEGFVWAAASGGMEFEVDLEKGGIYEVTTRCYSYLGDRLQNLAIDGKVAATVNFYQSSEWEDVSFGSFYLPAGKHTIEVGAAGSWGYMLYDTVTFGYATLPKLEISATPVDPKATPQTKSLMKYLSGVYGKQILSGQQEIYGSGHDGNYEYEFDYIKDTTGKLPVVRGFDFMNYNPLYGWDDNTTERAIAWAAEKNGIVTASWHLNVPIDFENYTLGDAVDWQQCSYKNYQASNSTFNTAKILEKDSKERAFFDEAVRMLAEQLQRLQDAGVPLIFRPLHEAQGNYGRYGDGTSWFWWGDRGPEVFKELWKLLYTELTETYNLHNIIWELNLYELDNSDEWYPGAAYVDLIAYDKYEGSPTTWGTDPAASVFRKLSGYADDTKAVALAECDRIPDINAMVNQSAWWLYICPWYDTYLTSETYNPKDMLKEFYTSDFVATLDEMPADLYTASSGESGTTATTTTSTSTTTTTTDTTGGGEQPHTFLLGDTDCNGDVDVRDAVLLARVAANDTTLKENELTDEGKVNADVDRNGLVNKDDLSLLLRILAKQE